ncbi:MAG: hypothetical protein ABW224_20805 [Kibdelosporangium sp.]
MGQFGELFGPGKLRKESAEDEGTGERFEHGPLDLQSGLIAVRPRRQDKREPDEAAEDPAE